MKKDKLIEEKRIGLITKAKELGLVKQIKHPATGEKVLLVGEEPKTDEWEELEDFANNRRNIKLKLSLNDKALTSSTKEIEELRDNNNQLSKSNNVWFHNFRDLTKEKTKLKSPLQKKDNIIKGMNQIIQKKTLTKEQVFGKDKLQTQRDDMDKFIRLLEIDLKLMLKKGDKSAVVKLGFVIEELKHLKQKHKEGE